MDVDVVQVIEVLCPITIANPIEALQVGRGFRGCDDVVNSYPILAVRQADFLNGRPQFFKVFGCIDNGFLNLRINPLTQIFLGQGNLEPLDILTNFTGVVRYSMRRRGRIFPILTGNGIEQLGIFLDRLGKRANLIQRATKGNQAKTRHRTIGRFESHNTAKGRRLADRTTRIRTQRQTDLTRSHRRSRTAG